MSFNENGKNFCLSLHYNGAYSYLIFNGEEIVKFKEKDSEIQPIPLYVGNFSRPLYFPADIYGRLFKLNFGL